MTSSFSKNNEISNAYQYPWEAVVSALNTNAETGLSEKETKKRLLQYGKNTLETHSEKSLVILFLEQFVSPLVWVLVVAAVLAFAFQEWLEGVAVVTVIFINALIGFFMEWQAVRSMEALRKLSLTYARVYRDGQLSQISSTELVPGDLIFLEAGDIVPADSRVLEATNLAIKEAALTGESVPVKKQTDALKKTLSLADRNNMLFKGTIVSRGNGKSIVTSTGKNTELGHIAHLTQQASKEATPLEKKLNVLSQKLIWLTLVLALFIFILGIIQGRDMFLMIETAIALAIAAIPEGLPIVATIALAKGMLRLARHKVVVKKLSAVETLGETAVIFTDKTGTLTENELLPDTLVFEFGKGDIFFENEKLVFEKKEEEYLKNTFAFAQLQKVATLCNNASLSNNTSDNDVGDPVEVALLKFSNGIGNSMEKIRETYPRLKEIPFDSDTKMMGTLHKNGKRPDYLVCIKGALEIVLKESDFILTKDGKMPLVNRQEWLDKADLLAAKGLRILSFAYSEIEQPKEDFFSHLIFIGFIGFIDPPRKEIRKAIQTSRNAGIRVVMLTGDHPETARNIAYKTGLSDKEYTGVIHGEKLPATNNCSTEDLKKILSTRVFARVNPAQKLDLVNIYQKAGYTVGMTGDGVNDTPALKKADIGIAMGLRGTEAAKEVADLVLEDDSFHSIVIAIQQGRGIFENIRYFVVFLLSCNLSELLVVAVAFLANTTMPLLPLQILFINMVTDVFPALALGMNREAKNIMNQPPRDKKEPIINNSMWVAIVVYSLALTIASIGILLFATYFLKLNETLANNYAFYTLILAQLWHVFNLPKKEQSFFNNEITANPFIWYAIIFSILIIACVYAIPVMRTVLHLHLIDWTDLGWIFLFSIIPVIFIQILKQTKIIL